MFRILLVEDDEAVCEAIASALKSAFGEITLDVTSYEDEAIAHVNRALGEGWPYDAALLDFQLPAPSGGFRMALSVCKHIMNVMPRTLVVHMTGYLEDPEIKQHIREMNLERVGPKELDFAKGSSSYDILRALKGHLHGAPIRRELDELFGSWEERSYGSLLRARMGSPAVRSVTHRVAALTRDITAHWDDLPEDLQQRIQAIFYIDPHTHKASLIGPQMNAR